MDSNEDVYRYLADNIYIIENLLTEAIDIYREYVEEDGDDPDEAQRKAVRATIRGIDSGKSFLEIPF